MAKKEKYIAFLRGINVGGHHKVPMADLRKELQQLDFDNIITVLNSGNIVFEAMIGHLEELEQRISEHLEGHFGFPIPTIVRKATTIQALFDKQPFANIEVTKEIRLYVSLLKTDKAVELELPWISDDTSFRILEKKGKNVLSVLDLSISKTPKAMKVLEQTYGKDITTRNWKTIERIVKKLRLL